MTDFFERITIWRGKHLREKQFIIMLSFVVGILSGLAAVVLKTTIHFTHNFLDSNMDIGTGSFIYLALPGIGIIFTVLWVNYFIKDKIGHGVSRILYSISKKNGILKPHNTYSSIIGSTFTIGFGGSVGAEAPIVLTGASIGSNLARMLRLNYKQIILLIGCGAAGAVAGIFKAPIAGVVFTLEVLMLDLTMASLIPLLISAATAAVISYFFMGHSAALFSFQLKEHFVIGNLPWYLVLGITAGLLSLYFTRTTMFVEGWFETFKKRWTKIIVGAIGLGLLIFIFPPLFGEGYVSLHAILSGDVQALLSHSFFYSLKDNFWGIVIFLSLLLVFKTFATSFTTGPGGVGGVFAPSLFMGGVLGFLVAILLNRFSFIHVSEANFALVGMAAFMSGVMHAPMTSIFLIAEITGGYGLFIPLITASTMSYLTIMYFEPHSIYTKRLARRGELITHNKDRAALTLMRLDREIERDLMTVRPDQTLRELVHIISRSKRNIFPVVNNKLELQGIVLLDNIRDIMFNPEVYDDTFVHELMTAPPDIVELSDSMEVVMHKFEESGAWNLPVIRDGKYDGFISKSKIYTAYRKVLVYFSEE
ncbi:MAG TPA: chloride channel protein [Marinilabiliales bacterium]|nr:MAG: chloride channel protein [Bacteroidetes bacterium GWA2_40_14]OFX57136.1 MAG: chloride channel protein [Bacteroidetes bacterium GWC2_40_13]OFX73180.1 MAG: chloride channel protein [Bacteroidetes bacterium GWD2_40_43]OFX91735.1 MAG: chloride channel protein [Bacteroidetes bacterium GWE2_40_63]OFY24545.1 MAG: chloride channel protein [Bacteroidetes bacterium GWF2_40_13]OFZ23817.1 MAG: chloride channel protein [Bacteroidetes bacterium RIFOXYC2_FULL_40_12]HAM99962.1 chloride channel protei